MSKIISHYNGPYIETRSGRRIISIVYTDKTKTNILYSRYLMQMKLKRKLLSSENVDHKDEDKTNDKIANLQILTRSQNTIKQLDYAQIRLGFGEFECPECFMIFTRKIFLVEQSSKRSKNYKGPFCSLRCGALFKHRYK